MPKRKITSYFRSQKKQKKSGISKPRYARPTKKRLSRRRVITTRRYRKKRRISSKIPVSRTNVQTIIFDNNDELSVPTITGTVGASDTVGKVCAYGLTGLTSDPGQHNKGLLGLFHIQRIAQALINLEPAPGATVNNETKINILRAYQTTEFVNNTNSICHLTAWKVMCRNDIATNGSNNYVNLLNLIGQGFYQRGLMLTDPGQNTSTIPFSTNQGCFDCELSLYDSHKFCSEFKILSQTKKSLDPGTSCSFTIKVGSRVINWNHYATAATATTTPSTASLDYCHRRGEMFYVYKLEGIPSNDNAGNLSYTSPVVQFITKTHYDFCAINPQYPLITKVTPQGYKTAGTLQIMNDDTASAVGSTRIV